MPVDDSTTPRESTDLPAVHRTVVNFYFEVALFRQSGFAQPFGPTSEVSRTLKVQPIDKIRETLHAVANHRMDFAGNTAETKRTARALLLRLVSIKVHT